MTLSTDVMAGLQKVVVADILRGKDSRIQTFLTRNTAGGWEPWFQVEAAHALITANLATDFNREQPVKNYPIPDGKGGQTKLVSEQKCDLVATGPRGVPIFMEFKTQRSGIFAATLAGFQSDIKKFTDYGPNWLKTYPCFAIAILTVNNNQAALDTLRQANMGHLEYYVFPKKNENADPMDKITDGILAYRPPAAGNILLAKWSSQL